MLPLLITIQNVFFDATDRLKKDEKGATAVEYGLIVGLIAVAIIAAITLLGGQLDTLFDNITGRIPAGAA
ncbi:MULTISPECIES: Flp family type IVb pilin [Kocuria]|uniref:Flp family type IVb pilin n=1 Tax=Kocuria TaxID=57493 RepID=UPI00036F59F5|nr:MULTISPECIES: Flp family type IVb pilin [Kocuria]EYT53359.1 pilus assembly protein [Kocuria sp. UCD-OTCP]PWF82240.1 Flp family type IVb pilin [Kocuria rosea]THE19302.1 Flp family type IVb pilin [Kocuria rosea]